ncbi:hypothetical protein RFM68_23955 [Mesorhizobium sp. MSK_1335]|uniref:DUF992 domain-containing protein n=1 Tax=Mesorhizobium montanum TaxID=3072323 RepID=A0ABU4ZTA5_9HYPH|nr:hypothetical protein [Mesorhizobium sp. MSK_1335]MDX8527559.1 hypothetical protein [Mesorhizobium sp. MSK_1335]
MKSMMLLLLAGGLMAATNAHADDADFLRSFQGSFAGNGTFKVSANSPTVNISCTFKSGATATSLSLDGECRGLILMTREISADLKATGGGYSGVYIGSRTGPAQLSGGRSGNALNLGIRWAKPVNGDRKAQLTVEKTSSDGMRLTVTDTDPKSGKTMVTSRIDLRRS